MAVTGTLLILLAAAAASLFTAWTIGAGSSGSTPFAPAVGANAIPVMRAAFVVGILGFAGAVLQGANVTETIGNELVVGVALSPVAATIALMTAAGLIAIGVFTGYPIATAFVVFGGVVGVGIAIGGRPAWPLYSEIAALWILTPPLGGGAAYGTARVLRSERVSERVAVPALAGVVGVIVANTEFTGLGPGGTPASIVAALERAVPVSGPVVVVVGSLLIATLVALPVARDTARNPDGAQRRFLLGLGGLVAFSAGGGKVGLAIGPLLPLLEAAPVPIPIVVVLVFGGLGLLAGSWMAATRMIKALAQDYSTLGPRRSIAVLIPSFAIAQVSIFFGLPMSFNEIFVSAIAGSGFAAGGESVSRRKMGFTVLAWVGSLALSLVVSYGTYLAVDAVF